MSLNHIQHIYIYIKTFNNVIILKKRKNSMIQDFFVLYQIYWQWIDISNHVNPNQSYDYYIISWKSVYKIVKTILFFFLFKFEKKYIYIKYIMIKVIFYYYYYFLGEDERREGVSARTMWSSGTIAASTAITTAPKSTSITTATTTTWSIDYPLSWLSYKSWLCDKSTKRQSYNTQPRDTIPTLSSSSSSSTRVNVPTALVAFIASFDRSDAQSFKCERT